MTSPSNNVWMIVLTEYGVTCTFVILGIGIGWYVGSRQSSEGMDDSSFMPFAMRYKLLFWAWVIAALGTVLIEIPLVIFFPMFPMGLAHMTGLEDIRSKQKPEDSGLFWAGVICFGGWFIYSALTGLALAARKPASYFVVYGILCLLLVFNVVGCHQILKNAQ